MDPKWKLRWHIVLFLLAVLVIILTGVYINMVPFITRPDIMAIPFVGVPGPIPQLLVGVVSSSSANQSHLRRRSNPSSSSPTSSSPSTRSGSPSGGA